MGTQIKKLTQKKGKYVMSYDHNIRNRLKKLNFWKRSLPIDMVADMEVDMVAGMEVNKAADLEVDR